MIMKMRTKTAVMAACAFLAFANSGYGKQTSMSVHARAVRIIAKNLILAESNPVWIEDARHLNMLFRNTLIARNRLSPAKRKGIYQHSLRHCRTYEDHLMNLEDSVDGYRTRMSGSIALATAALAAKPETGLKDLHHASNLLLGSTIIKDYSLDKAYAAFLVLKGLYLSEHKALSPAKKKLLIKNIIERNILTAQEKKPFLEVLRDFQ